MFKVWSRVANFILVVLCIVFFEDAVIHRDRLSEKRTDNEAQKAQLADSARQNGMLLERVDQLTKDVSAKDSDIMAKKKLIEVSIKNATDYRKALNEDHAKLIETRIEVNRVREELSLSRRRLDDRGRKLSGEYQRAAQDILNRLVKNGPGAVEWNEELDVFGIDYADRSPTVYSTRWAILRYDHTMFWLGRNARDTGLYYYYGNLGDITLPMLDHLVVGYKHGFISRDEAKWRLGLMERYVRPDDEKSIVFVSRLQEELVS